METKEFKLSGIVSVSTDTDMDELFIRFIEWVESQNATFAGGINPFDADLLQVE
jgi:hypothetical protein